MRFCLSLKKVDNIGAYMCYNNIHSGEVSALVTGARDDIFGVCVRVQRHKTKRFRPIVTVAKTPTASHSMIVTVAKTLWQPTA